jgi:sulfonate transport system ATP-binding protein
MQRLFESLWLESGSTAVLVTHDVDEAVALVDRVILLSPRCAASEWSVSLPRPRDRTNPGFSPLAQTILRHVMQQAPILGQAQRSPRREGAGLGHLTQEPAPTRLQVFDL